MRVVALVLLLSDALLAVLGFPPLTAMVVGAFAVAVWIGLRSLMGLYPGYGLSSAERLRRHVYSVGGALAAVSFIIVLDLRDIAPTFDLFVFDLYGDFPRLISALGFVGILLLSPLVQALVRWGLWRLGIWDSPVNDGPR